MVGVGVHRVRAQLVFLQVGQPIMVRIPGGAINAGRIIRIQPVGHFPPIRQPIAVAVNAGKGGVSGVADRKDQMGPDGGLVGIFVILHGDNAQVKVGPTAAQWAGGGGIDQAGVIKSGEGLVDWLLVYRPNRWICTGEDSGHIV